MIPFCDVIVLTFGNYDRLYETLLSISQQDAKIKTLVISDDGSKVPFPEKVIGLMRWFQNTDKFGRLLIRTNDSNLGTVQHMNLTASLCKSDYIKFLACGDVFYSRSSLRLLIEFAQQYSKPFVTSRAILCSKSLEKRYYYYPNHYYANLLSCHPDILFEKLCVKNFICAAACLFHCSFFSEFGGFNCEYRLLEDWPTWLRFTRNNMDIPFLDLVTCCYGYGGVSSESGDAYQSKALRSDMLRCYTNEILPYLERFSPIQRHLIYYYYSRLLYKKSWHLWLRYPDMQLFYNIKRMIKKWLIK